MQWGHAPDWPTGTNLLTATQAKQMLEHVSPSAAAHEELVNAVMVAYCKHHMNDDSIGWSELSGILHNALCNALGDDGFQVWMYSMGA